MASIKTLEKNFKRLATEPNSVLHLSDDDLLIVDDSVKPPNQNEARFEVAFRTVDSEGWASTVLRIEIFLDGTFRCMSSAYVNLAEPMTNLEVYARALKFIKKFGLKPR